MQGRGPDPRPGREGRAVENPDRKFALLCRCALFEGLSDPILRSLAESSVFRRFESGQPIFRSGSAGESMMIVAQGTVRISVLTPTARDVILTDIGEGEVFGEIAVLDGRGRTAEALALTKCQLLVLERRQLLKVIRAYPDLAIKLLELLCARIRTSDDRMMDFAFLQAPPRLARVLLQLSSQSVTAGGAPSKKIAQSQMELANMIGSSRENVNRCLSAWRLEGIVDLADGWVVILDRGALAEVAGAG